MRKLYCQRYAIMGIVSDSYLRLVHCEVSVERRAKYPLAHSQSCLLWKYSLNGYVCSVISALLIIRECFCVYS